MNAADTSIAVREVRVPVQGFSLEGRLALPKQASGLALFAHGSGSGRLSPRNLKVAGVLERAGLATLLFDLLTDDEAVDRARVFDIPLLAKRLTAAAEWARSDTDLAKLSLGFFGASTGAAAALWAAADLEQRVSAVVSRGGRPDLAGPRLALVTAPTLLIVGGSDTVVLELNRKAATELRCPHELVVVPGASHLFEEPGALESVAAHTAEWFRRYLVPGAAA